MKIELKISDINKFTCVVCRKTKAVQTNGGTGYAERDTGEKVCYDCCAIDDEKFMRKNGRISLYLTGGKPPITFSISNWPGTLKFPILRVTQGNHNIARTRVDVWFNGPDRFVWHGVCYGENTQILRCKRTKVCVLGSL